MKIADIASVTGKGGLFKIVAPTKSGVILESLDEQKTKLVTSASQRISVLSEISIYTTTKEGTTPLEGVLQKIFIEYNNDLGIDSEADPAELRAFLKSVVPDFDVDRVYVSDIKKLVKWYNILLQHAPSVLTKEEETPKA
jgi:hypothetical protein